MSLRSHSVLASSGRETSPFSTVFRRPEAASSARLAFRRARPSWPLALCLSALLLTTALHAQSCTVSTDFDASLPAWNTPLDRVVSPHARDIPLRHAPDPLPAAPRAK